MTTYSGTPATWVPGYQTAATFNAEIQTPLLALTGPRDTFMPTLSGFTAGNGVLSGRYKQAGKWIWYSFAFAFGSTSAAASAAPVFTLPVTALAVNDYTGSGKFVDASPSASYNALVYMPSTTQVSLWVPGTNGVYSNPSTTSPFTWTTNDAVYGTIIYEAA